MTKGRPLGFSVSWREFHNKERWALSWNIFANTESRTPEIFPVKIPDDTWERADTQDQGKAEYGAAITSPVFL